MLVPAVPFFNRSARPLARRASSADGGGEVQASAELTAEEFRTQRAELRKKTLEHRWML